MIAAPHGAAGDTSTTEQNMKAENGRACAVFFVLGDGRIKKMCCAHFQHFSTRVPPGVSFLPTTDRRSVQLRIYQRTLEPEVILHV
jgi:hypothetical protein